MSFLTKIATSLLCLPIVGCGALQSESGAVVDLTYRDGANAFSIQHTGGDTVWARNYYSDEKADKAPQSEYYFVLTQRQASYLDSILKTVDPSTMDSSWAVPFVDGSQYILSLRPSDTSPTYLHNSVNSDSPDPIAEWLIDASQKSTWLPSFHGHAFTSEMYLWRHRTADVSKEHMGQYLPAETSDPEE
jgi:hypothetical protein